MFKVGDIITGTEKSGNKYGITNSEATMEVVSVYNNGTIDVRVLEHKNPYDQRYSRDAFWKVDACFFVLVDTPGVINKSPIERKIAVMYKRFENKHAAKYAPF